MKISFKRLPIIITSSFALLLSSNQFRALAAPAPLEVRQGSGSGSIPIYAAVDAAANRLLTQVLTEIYNLNTALTDLTTIPDLNPPTSTLTTVENDIANITSNISGVSSVLANATAVTGCQLTVTDVMMILTNLGMAQSLVSTLDGAVGGLSSEDITALTSPLATLETAINGFNEDLQSYTHSLVPCINEVAPTLSAPVETALEGVGGAVEGLLGTLGLGNVVGEVAGIIPRV